MLSLVCIISILSSSIRKGIFSVKFCFNSIVNSDSLSIKNDKFYDKM